MNTPICFSKYFVDKYNLRSFDNVLKSKVFSYDDSTFCLYLLKSETSISSLTKELIQIFSLMKSNLKSKCKEDFTQYFNQLTQKVGLEEVDKEFIFKCSYQALCDIVPFNFFGNYENKKLFRCMVHDIIFSMKMQHLLPEKYLKTWDFDILPWRNISYTILHKILLWLLTAILPSIICLTFYVTTCKLDSDENKLIYFWKSQWQSFCDKKISKMLFSNVMEKFEPYCLGKKIKRNLPIAKRLDLKKLIKEVPKLHLVLKPNYDCRPIVKYRNDELNKRQKYRIKEKLQLLKLLTGNQQHKIETAYPKLHSKWLELNKPKLYFIKTDLSDAFGSINTDKMMKILHENYLNYHKTESNMVLKKRVSEQFRNLVAELRKPLLVRFGSTIFRWKEGLVQGYKYSPALSELYYSYMDKKYLTEHLKVDNRKIKMFFRVVDDYLYITDCFDDAIAFLSKISNYRNVNYSKTAVNFQHPSIRYSEDITFIGYSYNTVTLEVSRVNSIFYGQICYKINFTSAVENISKFIENRIGQSGIQISSHLFNLQYNSEELIWKHVFTTFCFSGNKFCTILAIACCEKDMKNYLPLYKKRVTVRITNAILENLMMAKPKLIEFVYCINHFRYLSWLALYYNAQKTWKCSNLIPLIKIELAKSNCLFGKWREHARFISSNGDVQNHAIKEICRRSDLRAIVKKMDRLPYGFEVYNKKKF